MKTQVLIGLAVTALLAVFASKANAQNKPTPGAVKASAHNVGADVITDTCPMQVPGTTVTTVDVKGAVALAFTTRTGDVAELRRRVLRASQMHNSRSPGGEMRMGGQGREGTDAKRGRGVGAAPGHVGDDRGGMIMGNGMMMPAAATSVENIKDGARLVFGPRDPAQLETLRAYVRTHLERVARGECPMMSAGGEGQETALPTVGQHK